RRCDRKARPALLLERSGRSVVRGKTPSNYKTVEQGSKIHVFFWNVTVRYLFAFAKNLECLPNCCADPGKSRFLGGILLFLIGKRDFHACDQIPPWGRRSTRVTEGVKNGERPSIKGPCGS